MNDREECSRRHWDHWRWLCNLPFARYQRALRIWSLLYRQRPQGVIDAFQWHCAACGTVVRRIEVQLEDIVADLPATYRRFYESSDAERTCIGCGAVHPGRDHTAWHSAWHQALAERSLESPR